MDPNETLRGIRELTKDLNQLRRRRKGLPSNHVVFQLTERLEALDEWLARGGSLPSDWAIRGQRH